MKWLKTPTQEKSLMTSTRRSQSSKSEQSADCEEDDAEKEVSVKALILKGKQDKEEREKIVRILAARGSDKFLLENYKLKTKETGNKDIIMSGNFTVGNYIHHLKKDVIVNMNILRHFEDDYIDTTDRKAAWYHDYKNLQKEVVILEIPKNYKVTYLPKNASGKLDDKWSYIITYKNDGKNIILTKEYKLNTMVVPPSKFVENNKAIVALENQYKESVVLTAKK